MTATLSAARAGYAEAMTARLTPPDAALRAAFAAVPREAFLPPPPWTLLGRHLRAQTDDPRELYADVLVVLDAAKDLNNGSPALHAEMLHLLAPRPGQAVLHVGAGGGYYTAILAELVGPGGSVTAVEYDAALAARATAALRRWPNVTVIHGDGAAHPAVPVDRIYVNFAVADLPDRWLDGLAPDGRLVVPLGAPFPGAAGDARRHSAQAAVLCVTRTATGFTAAFAAPVAFICAEGPSGGSEETRAGLYAAFAGGGLGAVRSLHRGPGPAGRTWFGTPRWSLGLDPP